MVRIGGEGCDAGVGEVVKAVPEGLTKDRNVVHTVATVVQHDSGVLLEKKKIKPRDIE